MITKTTIDRSKYYGDGFCEVRGRLSETEIKAIETAIDEVIESDPPGLVRESNSQVVRALQGPHLQNTTLLRLAQDHRILEPAREVLGSDVYLHQYKVNFKREFVGELWPWHQDYAYWCALDGIARPDLVTVAIALDEVSEFNGPLFFIRGSHNFGLIQNREVEASVSSSNIEKQFSQNLMFQLSPDDIRRMLEKAEIVAPKGPAGSILLFSANVAHASQPNLSPSPRRLVLITYNRVDNRPVPGFSERPEYIAGRCFEALRPISNFLVAE